LEICSKFLKVDNRVRIFDQPNKGFINALNFGISISKGEYIARFDQDDIMLKDRLMLQSKFLDENLNIGIVGSWVNVIDKEKKHISVWKYKYTVDDLLFEAILHGNVEIAHPAVMYKKSIFNKIDYYNKNYKHAEDTNLWFDAIVNRIQLCNLPISLINYRLHESQTTKIFNSESTTSRSLALNTFINSILNKKFAIKTTDLILKCNYKKINNENLKSFFLIIQELLFYYKISINSKRIKLYKLLLIRNLLPLLKNNFSFINYLHLIKFYIKITLI
jgi:glycosyltransferase involved in cell wall biosynthesis